MNQVEKLWRWYWARKLTLGKGNIRPFRQRTAPAHVKKFQAKEFEARAGKVDAVRLAVLFPESPFTQDMHGERWDIRSDNDLIDLYTRFGTDHGFVRQAATWARRSHGAIEARLQHLALVRQGLRGKLIDVATDRPIPFTTAK